LPPLTAARHTQGVFFRACTQQKAEQVGVVGRVRNTLAGSVSGTVQGPAEKVAAMKVRTL
jgi:acylphosphatase